MKNVKKIIPSDLKVGDIIALGEYTDSLSFENSIGKEFDLDSIEQVDCLDGNNVFLIDLDGEDSKETKTSLHLNYDIILIRRDND